MEELRKLIKLEDNLNEEKHLRVWNGKYKKTKLSIIVKVQIMLIQYKAYIY